MNLKKSLKKNQLKLENFQNEQSAEKLEFGSEPVQLDLPAEHLRKFWRFKAKTAADFSFLICKNLFEFVVIQIRTHNLDN